MEVFERPTLAQVFRRFYPRYRQHSDVTPEQRRAVWCIQVCRTPALGEAHWQCEHCGQEHSFHPSCGNRHCPVCQGSRSLAWLEEREEQLLPVPYFHVVFSVASELNPVIGYNRRLLYQELFRQSAGTLQTFARDPQWLGAQLGFFGVLHTWGQTLTFHPHIHYIVPQGGLDAQGRWVRPQLKDQARFLFPIGAVSEVFRGRLLHRLEQLHAQGRLRFPDPLSQSSFPDQLRLAASKPWEVYAQRPFAGPESLLRYLSLYTHRAAISSGRLLECDAHTVRFAYKDYRQQGRIKSMRLGGEVFLGRFLQHVAPQGFRRIRYYGFWANAAGRQVVGQLQADWLGQMLACVGVLRQWAQELEQAQANETVDRQPVCPRCGRRALRYLPPQLQRVRADDTS